MELQALTCPKPRAQWDTLGMLLPVEDQLGTVLAMSLEAPHVK